MKESEMLEKGTGTHDESYLWGKMKAIPMGHHNSPGLSRHGKMRNICCGLATPEDENSLVNAELRSTLEL